MFGLEDNTQLTELEAMTTKETIKISQIFEEAEVGMHVADTQILGGKWYLTFVLPVIYIEVLEHHLLTGLHCCGCLLSHLSFNHLH